jgi:hypothetical protein
MSAIAACEVPLNASWIPALLLLSANASQAAQVFSNDTGRVRWEAEVTQDSFVLRETRGGASTGTDFVCPLGPAVRASVVRAGAEGGKVCLVFSKDKCGYTGAQGAPAHVRAPDSGVAAFKCLELETPEHASKLATLINGGPPMRPHVTSVPAAVSKKSAQATRSPRSPVGASGPQKGSPTPARPPAAGSTTAAIAEPEGAAAKMLARAQDAPAVDSTPRADRTAASRTSPIPAADAARETVKARRD